MKRIALVLVVAVVLAGGYRYWSRSPARISLSENSVRPAFPIKRDQISAFNRNILAISKAGDIYGWGDNEDKQLGLPNVRQVPLPKQLTTGIQWRSVNVGQLSSYAIAADGSLWRRPYDFSWVGFGDPAIKTRRHIDYEPLNWEQRWVKVQERSGFGFGLDESGHLWRWKDRKIPREAQRDVGGRADVRLESLGPEGQRWADFCLFSHHIFFAVAVDGTLWGSPEHRDTIPPTRPPEAPPLEPIAVPDKFQRVYCESGSHVMAMTRSGRLWGRGPNTWGELGDGDGSNSTPNTKAFKFRQLGPRKWVELALGVSFTLAIAPDGSLWAWGFNTEGQLGVGHTQPSDSPVLVDKTRVYSAIAATPYCGAAMTRDGELYTWGANRGGCLGDGGGGFSHLYPSKVYGDTVWGLDANL